MLCWTYYNLLSCTSCVYLTARVFCHHYGKSKAQFCVNAFSKGAVLINDKGNDSMQ